MQTKILEIRDRATFIPVLCTYLDAEPGVVEYWYLRRCGYYADGHIAVMMTRLSGEGPATCDPYHWNDRTFKTAHLFILRHWYELKSGDVVDVEFILGETPAPKVSERYEVQI